MVYRFFGTLSKTSPPSFTLKRGHKLPASTKSKFLEIRYGGMYMAPVPRILIPSNPPQTTICVPTHTEAARLRVGAPTVDMGVHVLAPES